MLFLTLLGAGSLGASQPWVKLNTAHFELYTTAGEQKGRELLLYCEEVRGFFAQELPVRGVTDFPVRVILFGSQKDFEPYAPNEVATGFYTRGQNRDYIVMADTDAAHLRMAAVHEYTHLVLTHRGLKLPIWLNEGWADLYSTLKPMGDRTKVGDLLPGRVRTLETEPWLSFDTLTSADAGSEVHNERNLAGVFYAESWALVHMLYFSPEYAPNFTAFVDALDSGKSTAEACQIAYGHSPDQIYADLQSYIRRAGPFGTTVEVKLTRSEEEVMASQPKSLESQLVEADLLGVSGKGDRAKHAFEQLAAQNPGNSEIARSLGYLAWKDNDREGARLMFEKAFAAGDSDPQMCFRMALLELEKSVSSERAQAALERAVQVKPDYTDAWVQGFVRMNARQYPGALAAFTQVDHIDDARAAKLHNALAYVYAHTGAFDEARKQSALALQWDRTDSEKKSTQDMLRYLDALPQTALRTENTQTVSIDRKQ